MIESILYKTVIYCRLSLDDGSLGESGSIQTQKMMLEKYCRDNNFTIKEVYIDDTLDIYYLVHHRIWRRVWVDIVISSIKFIYFILLNRALLNKIIKERKRNEIDVIEEANIMKNPVIRIKNIDGTEIHLDKRKSIIQALEKYSKKKIIK